MRMLLRPEFPNGLFGDPALYVGTQHESGAILVDCGALGALSVRKLLRVKQVFLSHCHMDHFVGFDFLLRVHMGVAKCIDIFGPPQTSERVGGKLQGYTWNLIHDQDLSFRVSDIHPESGRIKVTEFHSRNAFKPSGRSEREWNPSEPVFDAGIYQVRTAMLDHHTPSMAYVFEEKPALNVDRAALTANGFKPGPWINDLKELFLFGDMDGAELETPLLDGGFRRLRASELMRLVLVPRQRHRIAYATDGAAHERNRGTLLDLISGADWFYSETCFLEADRPLADQSKHFTARFIGELAREAGVKRLAPFHLSKRYLHCSEQVLSEASNAFGREIVLLGPFESEPQTARVPGGTEPPRQTRRVGLRACRPT